MITIGADIVRISRIKRLSLRERERIFQPTEINQPARTLAGIFAAKEAVKKALGAKTGWLDIEIKKSKDGSPFIKLSDEKGLKEKSLTISHDGNYAIAVVVLIK